MRTFSEKEEKLYAELEKPDISVEERKRLIEELKEEEIRATNGHTWLT